MVKENEPSDTNDTTSNNRLSPEARYARDPNFHSLVDILGDLISRCEYTPTELREAVMLAAKKEEYRSASQGVGRRPKFIDKTPFSED